MLCFGKTTASGDRGLLPNNAGQPGMLGGEVDDVGVLRFAGNLSSVLVTAAGGLGRGRGKKIRNIVRMMRKTKI